MTFTFNAYMLIYALVFGSTRAQNYCQWSGIAHTSKYGTLVKESVYYRTMYLFESSSCSGTSCVLNAVYPAVKKAADNVPSSNVKYICDNQPHPAGSNSPALESQVAYICTVCDIPGCQADQLRDSSAMALTLPQFPWLSTQARFQFLVRPAS